MISPFQNKSFLNVVLYVIRPFEQLSNFKFSWGYANIFVENMRFNRSYVCLSARHVLGSLLLQFLNLYVCTTVWLELILTDFRVICRFILLRTNQPNNSVYRICLYISRLWLF